MVTVMAQEAADPTQMVRSAVLRRAAALVSTLTQSAQLVAVRLRITLTAVRTIAAVALVCPPVAWTVIVMLEAVSGAGEDLVPA